MSVKIMLDIKGALYDMWEFRSVERAERYNEKREAIDYLLIVNKNAIATNYNDLEIPFDTEEEREEKLKLIKQKFDESDNIVIL